MSKRDPGFGDDTFPGRGRSICYACGRPVVEHPVGPPCPLAAEGVDHEIYTENTVSEDTMGRKYPRFKSRRGDG